jgi:hypothetical protein
MLMTGASCILATIGLATPAHAAVAVPNAPLSVSSLCEADGGSKWDCVLLISGGTSPYQTTWTNIQNAFITHSGTDFAVGSCTGSSYIVQFKVVDAAGHHVKLQDGSVCLAGPPP